MNSTARASDSHRLMMNGGDHHWPDPKLPATLEMIRGRSTGFSTTARCRATRMRSEKGSALFRRWRGNSGSATGTRLRCSAGVYSSRMYIKQANWQPEAVRALRRTPERDGQWHREGFAATARAARMEDPDAEPSARQYLRMQHRPGSPGNDGPLLGASGEIGSRSRNAGWKREYRRMI